MRVGTTDFAERPESLNILGVRLDLVTQRELHAEIERVLDSGQKQMILNVNINCLNLANTFPWLRDFLNDSHLVFCDGHGVVLGAFILGHYVPERITFADWIYPLSGFAAEHGYTLFFLGAKPGVAQRAASRLTEIFPKLKIVGAHHGYFDKTPGSEENQMVIDMINAARPDILFVCFGMPIQERWLLENWKSLDAKTALAGGAVLDYTAGVLKRPPRWMIALGLEWLGRVIIEPGRLWRRYLIGIPVFLWRIVLQKLNLRWNKVELPSPSQNWRQNK